MNPTRQVILGLFFFVTMIVLGVVTIVLSETWNPFQSQRWIEVHFANVDGLLLGDPVLVYGTKVGSVKEILLEADAPDPARRLRVKMTLAQSMELRETYRIEIVAHSLLGGKRVEVSPGEGAVLDPDIALLGGTRPDIVGAVGILLDEVREPLNRTLESVADIMARVSSDERSLASFLLDRPALDDLYGFLASADRIAEKVDSGPGTLALLLNQPDAHDRLVNVLDSGSVLLERIVEGDGTVSRLVNDDEIYQNLVAGSVSLRTLLERTEQGDNLVGQALHPDSVAVFDDVVASVGDLRSIVADVRAGRGVAGKILADPELGDELAQMVHDLGTTSADLQRLVDGLSRGRGALGYLLADDQAARDLRKIVEMIAGALEDAREAAPVSSLGSFLFGNL